MGVFTLSQPYYMNNIFRFVGLGTLPMQAPELAVQEIKRCKGTKWCKEELLLLLIERKIKDR